MLRSKGSWWNFPFSAFSRESSPLVPRGFGGPKFLENSQEKFLANEDENAYVQLEVFGDPAPKVQWFKVKGGG